MRDQSDLSADDEADQREPRQADVEDITGAAQTAAEHEDDSEDSTGISAGKREHDARDGKAAKGRPGRRRHATIKTVENLGAAAALADAAVTTDKTTVGDERADARTDLKNAEVDDAAARLDAAVEGDMDLAEMTAADDGAAQDGDHQHLFDTQEDDDEPRPSFEETAAEDVTEDSSFSERPVGDPLARSYAATEEPALLDIADDNGDDSLDLAEFVIQAAVSGEEDDPVEPSYQPPAWSPERSRPAIELTAAAGEASVAAAQPELGRSVASVDRDDTAAASSLADTPDTGSDFDIFGAPPTDDADTADKGDSAASSGTPGAEAEAPANQDAHAGADHGRSAPSSSGDRPLDHRYVSPDLRIPMIDEDDIPSVEAVYLFDDAPEDDAPKDDTPAADETALDIAALAAEADDDAHQSARRKASDEPANATSGPETSLATGSARDESAEATADDHTPLDRAASVSVSDDGVEDGDAVAAEPLASATAASSADAEKDGSDATLTLEALATEADTSQTAPAAARESATDDAQKAVETTAKAATTTTIRRPTASAHHPSAKTDKAGEGDDDVNASRLFSALSLKRLAIPPHVFEARQRVNVISGLAIIAALGFVGWYFSAPSTVERQLIVETKDPASDKTAAASATATTTATPKGKDPAARSDGPLVGASGERTGLIYRPLKKVETTALTAIGDLEYKITPSKFYRVVRVKKGDTFGAVLIRAGVGGKEAAQAVRSMRSIYDPRKLRIGREIRVAFGVAGSEQTRFLGFRFDSSYDRSVHVARQQSGEFASAEVKKNVLESYSRVDGTITTSLFGSGMRAGAPAQTMVQMIHLFSFAVDFQRDLRGGEKFEILFRSQRDEAGRIVRTGEIAYASLTVRGRTHRLYWYKPDKKGSATYLNEQGQGNRKALMKTPIDGARLTSGFGMRRHPILGYSKLHTGTDFGARTGTPIYAAGDGTIVKIGWHGGYGRYIRIRHGKVYQTAYAHMSRFRSGLKTGSRVKQGETIGYVGSTGRSTGPHLHYEVLKNGKHVNPMTITLPSRKRLQGRALQRFLAHRKKIDQRFAQLGKEKSKRQDGAVQTVKSDRSKAAADAGCKNGIRINPLDDRPCSN